MIIHISEHEGGIWIQCDSNNLPFKPHSVKYGKWIYDYHLKKVRYNLGDIPR